MTIAVTRMNELATRYGGAQYCITPASVLVATHEDLTEQTDLASWDIEWIYNNVGYCIGTAPPPDELVLQPRWYV